MTRDEVVEIFPELAEPGGVYEPETAEAFDWFPYYCKDCDTYHNMWAGYGFENVGGEIMVTEWTCDGDGDWVCDGGFPLEEFDARQDQAAKESIICANDYYEFVAETGTDPLGEFFSVKSVEDLKTRARAAINAPVALTD